MPRGLREEQLCSLGSGAALCLTLGDLGVSRSSKPPGEGSRAERAGCSNARNTWMGSELPFTT